MARTSSSHFDSCRASWRRPAGGEPVVLVLAILVRRLVPARRDEAVALQAMERRIERPVLDDEDVIGRLADVRS